MRSIVFAAFATLLVLAGSSTRADRPGDIVVSGAWSRPTPVGAPSAVGYLVLANHGLQTDRLLSVESPAAGQVSIHKMSMTGGIMRMRPIVGGLAVPPGASVSLDPDGDHLMFEGLKRPFRTGDLVPAILHFQHAGEVRVGFEVR